MQIMTSPYAAPAARPDGYAAVTDFFVRDPDSETLVFRKFGHWSARTLLYKQARLMALEEELCRLEKKLSREHDIVVALARRSWRHFEKLAESNIGMKELMALSLKMDISLQDYHDCLLRQAGIASLQHPSARVLSALRRELHGPSRQPNQESLLGALDRTILDDEADLVALKPPVHEDLLSRSIRKYWPFQLRSASSQADAQTWHFEERRILWIAGVISTLIAGLLLIGSILALYWTTSPGARLALVLLFIVLFALSVSACTGASRDGIFAATAAYAAVLVVFVSGNLGNVNTDSGSGS